LRESDLKNMLLHPISLVYGFHVLKKPDDSS
jgi:hypothetical protein